jgi:hypothetical protein
MGSVDSPGGYSTLSLSRDGKRVAFQANTGNSEVNQDIWIHDFSSRTTNRLTSDRELETAPIWSTDGTRIAYAAARNGKQDIYQKLADFTGDEELLVKAKGVAYPLDWSRDGHFLLYAEQGGPASGDLWVLPLEPGVEPKPLLATQFTEMQARFSPTANLSCTCPMKPDRSKSMSGHSSLTAHLAANKWFPRVAALSHVGPPQGALLSSAGWTHDGCSRNNRTYLHTRHSGRFVSHVHLRRRQCPFVHYWDVTPEAGF